MGEPVTVSFSAGVNTNAMEIQLLNAAPSRSVKYSVDDIRAEVTPEGRLRLVPLTALGTFFLSTLGHTGDLAPMWHYTGANGNLTAEENRKSLTAVELFTRNPSRVLSVGDDPYYSGINISNDEAIELRKHLDRIRAKRRKATA